MSIMIHSVDPKVDAGKHHDHSVAALPRQVGRIAPEVIPLNKFQLCDFNYDQDHHQNQVKRRPIFQFSPDPPVTKAPSLPETLPM